MESNEVMLSLKSLKKTFYPGTVNERKALDNFSLDLDAGEFVTILGSNGAGKSTLFNVICGSFFVDAGEILLDGKNITYLPDYKRALEMGRLFQDPMKGTAPNMTIEENLSLSYCRKAKKGLFALNKHDSDYYKSLLEMLNLGLEDRMKTKIGQLSGGQRQAVSLLMSTISSPKMLLLDEHTAALDPGTAIKVLDITKKVIEKNNITTMMITHDMNSALELGTRTIMMDSGRIVLDIKGKDRENLTPGDLIAMYSSQSNKEFANDRMLLSMGK